MKPFLTPSGTFLTQSDFFLIPHKHLGLMLSSNLDWSYQVQYVCLRADRKLEVLRSIKFIQRRILDFLYKITICSVIDYALPVYWHTLNLSEKNKVEQIQYKSEKLDWALYPIPVKIKLILNWSGSG